jgi:hypothetical protein
MGVLRPIVQILRSTMHHAAHQPSVGHTVAGQLVGDQDPRHGPQPRRQPTEEPLRGPGITAGGDQDVQNIPVLVDSPPQVVALPTDLDEHLVEMPLIARARSTATQSVGEGLTELAAPLMDGPVRDQDTAREHHLLDLPQAQGKAEVQPHTVTDDLHRVTVPPVQRRRRGVHEPSLTHLHQATEHPNPVNLTSAKGRFAFGDVSSTSDNLPRGSCRPKREPPVGEPWSCTAIAESRRTGGHYACCTGSNVRATSHPTRSGWSKPARHGLYPGSPVAGSAPQHRKPSPRRSSPLTTWLLDLLHAQGYARGDRRRLRADPHSSDPTEPGRGTTVTHHGSGISQGDDSDE